MPRSHTIVVVPCYNEAARLDHQQFANFAQDCSDVHLLFVNDGSTDETLHMLNQLAATNPHQLFVHDLEHNVGKAEAVRQGMLEAFRRQPDYVGFWDADLATPLDAIPRFCELMENQSHLQVVVGSRIALLGHDVRRKFRRHLLGRAFASVVSLMLGFAVYDTQCGAKLFRTSQEIEEIFQQPFCSRWIFDVEIFARLMRQSQDGKLPPVEHIVYEHPLRSWEDVDGSKLKLRDFFVAAFDLVKVYRTYLAGTRNTSVPLPQVSVDSESTSIDTGRRRAA